MNNEQKGPWFQNRQRGPFTRLAVLVRKEELIASKREKFAPLQVSNLFDLLVKMHTPPRKIPGVLSCIDPIPGDYKTKFRKMLDPYDLERETWTKKKSRLQRHLSELRTMPWSTPSHAGMWEREAELQQTSLLINDLEVKLSGLPPTNTFSPVDLYRAPTDLELEKAGIITHLDDIDPRFTPKGLEVYRTMEKMKRQAMGELQGRYPIDSEEEIKKLALQVWEAVESAYARN